MDWVPRNWCILENTRNWSFSMGYNLSCKRINILSMTVGTTNIKKHVCKKYIELLLWVILNKIAKNISYLHWNRGSWRSASYRDVTMTDCSPVVSMDAFLSQWRWSHRVNTSVMPNFQVLLLRESTEPQIMALISPQRWDSTSVGT